jgi:hypothetical protein
MTERESVCIKEKTLMEFGDLRKEMHAVHQRYFGRLKTKRTVFKNGVKNIYAAAYIGAHTVHIFHRVLQRVTLQVHLLYRVCV